LLLETSEREFSFHLGSTVRTHLNTREEAEVVKVAHSQAKPHGQLEEHDRENRNENQRVPFALDLNGQTAEACSLLGCLHAFNDQIAEKHGPQAETELWKLCNAAHSRENCQSDRSQEPESEEVANCADRALGVSSVRQVRK